MFTMHTYAPYAVTKCYLQCADRTQLNGISLISFFCSIWHLVVFNFN